MNRPSATWLLGLALIASSACQSSKSEQESDTSSSESSASASAAAEAPKAQDAVIRRGAPLGDAPTHALAAILKDPKQFEGKTIKTTGLVRKACSNKGCWMELAESKKKGTPGCRVTFKDYGFFVPLDAAGSQATLQGEVQMKTISKSHVDHYESEGAVFTDKNEDGSANEVRLVAAGVELVR